MEDKNKSKEVRERDIRNKKEWLEAAKRGDTKLQGEIFQRVVDGYLPLLIKETIKMKKRTASGDRYKSITDGTYEIVDWDYVGELTLALHEAFVKYNPETTKANLVTYAFGYFRSAIGNLTRQELGMNATDYFYKQNKKRAVAKFEKMGINDLDTALRLAKITPNAAFMPDDIKTEHCDFISERDTDDRQDYERQLLIKEEAERILSNSSAEEDFFKRALGDDIEKITRHLSKSQKEILNLKAGLDDEKERTIDEVADVLGLTTRQANREWLAIARQIRKNRDFIALARERGYLPDIKFKPLSPNTELANALFTDLEKRKKNGKKG